MNVPAAITFCIFFYCLLLTYVIQKKKYLEWIVFVVTLLIGLIISFHQYYASEFWGNLDRTIYIALAYGFSLAWIFTLVPYAFLRMLVKSQNK